MSLRFSVHLHTGSNTGYLTWGWTRVEERSRPPSDEFIRFLFRLRPRTQRIEVTFGEPFRCGDTWANWVRNGDQAIKLKPSRR